MVGRRKTYAFRGKVRGSVLVEPGYIEMASPTGFEPVLPP